MDNFLTTLYFELFTLTEREKRLMGNNTWEDSPSGHDANIRNDQSISEVRQTSKILQKLIEEYLRNRA